MVPEGGRLRGGASGGASQWLWTRLAVGRRGHCVDFIGEVVRKETKENPGVGNQRQWSLKPVCTDTSAAPEGA